MRKIFRLLLVCVLLLCLTISPTYAKRNCETNDLVYFDNVFALSIFSWSVNTNNCCSPTSGSAFFSANYYDQYGNYQFTVQGYISIANAQYLYGCDGWS